MAKKKKKTLGKTVKKTKKVLDGMDLAGSYLVQNDKVDNTLEKEIEKKEIKKTNDTTKLRENQTFQREKESNINAKNQKEKDLEQEIKTKDLKNKDKVIAKKANMPTKKEKLAIDSKEFEEIKEKIVKTKKDDSKLAQSKEITKENSKTNSKQTITKENNRQNKEKNKSNTTKNNTNNNIKNNPNYNSKKHNNNNNNHNNQNNNLNNNNSDKSNKINVDEKIQSFISILFSVIIFIALILLILVLYNQFFKEEEEINKQELCQEFMPKDYGITNSEIKNYLLNLRGVIYNINNFDIKNYQNENLLELATYFIWSVEGEYLTCNKEIDSHCLVSYKEMEFSDLKKKFKTYFNLPDLTLTYKDIYTSDDDIRLYQINDKIILTFNEFMYQTLRHDFVDIQIQEDEIKVIFALSSQIAENEYSYKGYKNIYLKYQNKKFVIEKIETVLLENQQNK